MTKANPVPVYDTATRRSPALEEVRELIRYRHLVSQWVRRDIITRYKRSALGIAWTMLNPLGTTLILAVVFSKVFNSTITNFAGYVLTGLIPWIFFSQASNGAMTGLVGGGGLIKRIYFPRTAHAVTAIGVGLINLFLSLIPMILIITVLGYPPHWTIIALPIPILFLALFSLGLGLILSNLAIYFYDVVDMYQIVLTAWFYLSPVIYKEDMLPQEIIWLVRLNPMYYLINLFRAPIYDGRIPTMEEMLPAGAVALVTFLVGWWFFCMKADAFAYRL
jgi:ABC-type polysaccharide/polyol phosphate export permease